MRTHVERWLKINRGRLSDEQISVVEEAIAFITPDKYEEDRDIEKVEREAMALEKKVFAAFSEEDAMQMVSPRSAYIPDTDEEKI